MNTHPIKTTLFIVLSFIMAFTILPAASFADTAGGSEEELSAQSNSVSISAEDVTAEDVIEYH